MVVGKVGGDGDGWWVKVVVVMGGGGDWWWIKWV